jgi:hypothetical protein
MWNGVHSASLGQLNHLNEEVVASVWKTEINCRGNSLRWPHNTLYPQRLALTSPRSAGRSVGIFCLRTTATEFSIVCQHLLFVSAIIWRLVLFCFEKDLHEICSGILIVKWYLSFSDIFLKALQPPPPLWQGAEENIWTEERWSDGRLEETA